MSDEEDLTRKQRREQARAQRKALEQAEADRAVRRTRLTQLGVVVAVVVVAVVAILIATGSGSKSSGAAKVGSGKANATVASVNSLIGGIPQAGTVLGSQTAPATLQYFADLECPICKDFTLAAGKQGKLWPFVEIFYHEQGEEGSGYVTEQYLQNIAQQVPALDISAWTTARNDPSLTAQLTTDAQLATASGFTGTPSFLIGKTGGAAKKLEYASLTDPASFNAAIEKVLKA
jgi:protein-disulfide isomerase